MKMRCSVFFFVVGGGGGGSREFLESHYRSETEEWDSLGSGSKSTTSLGSQATGRALLLLHALPG